MMRKFACASLATVTLSLVPAAGASAQAPAATESPNTAQAPPAPPTTPAADNPVDPNPGALSFTGNMDFLAGTPYIFRGIVQEAKPELTMWPAGDIGISLYSGEKALKSASFNFGIWNSLHTGSSGLDNSTSKKQHYEEDFYAALGLGFSKAAFTTTYTAYTSPNGMFGTVHEIAFKTAIVHRISPYVLVAQELGAVGADGGSNKGTYVELGVGPSWPVAGGKATIGIPVKVGLSASNYYELNGVDNKFGFLDIGALFTVPLTAIPSNFGAWNVHVGGEGFLFGETTKAINAGKKSKGVFLFGFGVGY